MQWFPVDIWKVETTVAGLFFHQGMLEERPQTLAAIPSASAYGCCLLPAMSSDSIRIKVWYITHVKCTYENLTGILDLEHWGRPDWIQMFTLHFKSVYTPVILNSAVVKLKMNWNKLFAQRNLFLAWNPYGHLSIFYFQHSMHGMMKHSKNGLIWLLIIDMAC